MSGPSCFWQSSRFGMPLPALDAPAYFIFSAILLAWVKSIR